MDITSAPIRAEPNGSNVIKNFALEYMFFGFFGFKLLLAEDSVALEYMFFGFFGFKLLLAEDSVRSRVSKNVANLGKPET